MDIGFVRQFHAAHLASGIDAESMGFHDRSLKGPNRIFGVRHLHHARAEKLLASWTRRVCKRKPDSHRCLLHGVSSFLALASCSGLMSTIGSSLRVSLSQMRMPWPMPSVRYIELR